MLVILVILAVITLPHSHPLSSSMALSLTVAILVALNPAPSCFIRTSLRQPHGDGAELLQQLRGDGAVEQPGLGGEE